MMSARMKKGTWIFGALGVAVVLTVSMSVYAQHGRPGVFLHPHRFRIVLDQASGKIAAPGGLRHDANGFGTVLVGVGQTSGQRIFRIQIDNPRRKKEELVFFSKDPFARLASRDLNRDGAFDLVVEQSFTRIPLRVWLNDGHGNFRLTHADRFIPSGRDPPHDIRALPPEKDSPGRRSLVKRGTKIDVDRAKSQSGCDSSTRPCSCSPDSTDHREGNGPKPSRAPPFLFL